MEITQYTVRRARAADMAAVARLAAELVRAHHRMDPARFMAFPEPIEPNYQFYLTTEIKNPQAVLLVAVAGPGETGAEQVLGYAWGQMRGRDYMAMLDAGGVVQDVYVAPQARRKGVARALVGAMAAALHDLGAQRVVLHTAELNQPARKLFADMGFRTTMREMTLTCPHPNPGPIPQARS